MDFEFWWLLSWPLFFALGWVAARIDIRHLLRESRSLPRSYLSGLNFLVNEQPDKAIDAFLEAVRIDPQTIELHFALGSLFRRRGEVDRSIRIHQSLVDREDLSADQRLQALEELGQDYLKAGLLDRAEAAYSQLRDTPLRETALRALLEIYQQEKNWNKAIEIARQMPGNDHQWEREIANFHCELASTEMAHSRYDAALQQVDEALRVNRRCVRAAMLQGDIHAALGDDVTALESWKRIEQMEPGFLSQVAERMMDAYRRANDADAGIQLLRYYLDRYPSLDLLDSVFQWDMEHQGPHVAYALVRDELKRNPTVLGLNKSLEAAVFALPAEKRTDVRADQGPHPRPHTSRRALLLRTLWFQGTTVLLALPGLW